MASVGNTLERVLWGLPIATSNFGDSIAGVFDFVNRFFSAAVIARVSLVLPVGVARRTCQNMNPARA